ncbi:MAG: Asp-tRNA(Asn)/Glu-tRNA(Gln) amidotransferase subunit GatC [Pseudomonadota bacterium]
MTAIDAATVAKVARLARIRIDAEEQDRMAGELTRILDWIDQLGEVDVDGVAPVAGGAPDGHAALRWRDDAVTAGGDPDAVTGNAPDATQGFYVVPKVVE